MTKQQFIDSIGESEEDVNEMAILLKWHNSSKTISWTVLDYVFRYNDITVGFVNEALRRLRVKKHYLGYYLNDFMLYLVDMYGVMFDCERAVDFYLKHINKSRD